jgi:hypothetical protein
MLISYPILRQDNIHDDEDIYLANVIESALVNTEGRYPISTLTTPQKGKFTAGMVVCTSMVAGSLSGPLQMAP